MESCDVFGLIREDLLIGIVAVSQEGQIMNLALFPEVQNQYYGWYMIYYLMDYYRDKFRWLRIAVSGDKVPYFKRLMFKRERAGTVKDFYRWKYPRSRRKHRKLYDPWDLVYMRVRIGK